MRRFIAAAAFALAGCGTVPDGPNPFAADEQQLLADAQEIRRLQEEQMNGERVDSEICLLADALQGRIVAAFTTRKWEGVVAKDDHAPFDFPDDDEKGSSMFVPVGFEKGVRGMSCIQQNNDKSGKCTLVTSTHPPISTLTMEGHPPNSSGDMGVAHTTFDYSPDGNSNNFSIANLSNHSDRVTAQIGDGNTFATGSNCPAPNTQDLRQRIDAINRFVDERVNKP